MATDLTYAYAADITKAERDANGDLYVYGKATGPDKDLDGQRCDPTWLKSAMPEWFEWGNVREMHQPVAAGVGVSLVDDGDDWFVKSLVVDDGTAKRIEKQVLKGYSIGVKDPHIQVRGGEEWIVGGNIVEISYVDRPCNPTAKLAICKAAGADGKLQPVEADPDEVTIKVAGSVFSPADLAKLLAAKKSADPDVVKSDKDDDSDDGGSEGGETVDDGDGEDTETKTKTKTKDKKAKAAKAAKADTADAAVLAQLAKQYGLTTEQAQKIPVWLRPAVLGATADTAKREFTAAERDNAADAGQALPDGSFPIKSVQDLRNAVKAIGRAKDPAKAKAHIKRRAKALGRQDLVPDEWKTTDPDLTKADTEQIHDPGEIAAVRDGLVALIKAELDELCDGDQELSDVSELLCSLRMLMCWWDGEAAAGETDSPYSKPTTAGSADVMYAAEPDLTKSSDNDDTQTTESTGDSTDDRLAELVKSAVAAEKKALTEAAEERTKALEAELETVRADLAKALALPEPGGPVITRTPALAAAAKAADADLLKQQAADLKQRAEQVEGYDPNLARGYRLRAQELLSKAVA